MASPQQAQEKSPSSTRPPDESLSSRLPRSLRGYDRAATDALFGELASRIAELERECAKLREEAAGLDADLARHREHEQLVSKTLLEATSHATTIREKAREEAELFLRKAREQAAERAAETERAERDRADAEHELARMRQLAHEMQQRLADFLTQTLQQLRPEPGTGEHRPAADSEEGLVRALEGALKQEGSDEPRSEGDALHPTGEITRPPQGT